MSQAHISPVRHRLPSTATGDQAIPTHESHPTPRCTPLNSPALCTDCEQAWPLGKLNRPHSSGTFIHILDQDSLLHIFYLCRPVLLDEDETDNTRILQGGVWNRERWWYKLAQVCRRWRYLILGSANHLRLSLVCSRGTPVAEMLENSPPLPIIIDHVDHRDSITTGDGEGIILALRHHDRVRRIRLLMPVPNLQKVIVALDKEFSMLEWLYIRPPAKQSTSLILPVSFRAPHLRHLKLSNFVFPIGSLLLTTAVGLVTLSLDDVSPSVHLHINDLVHRLSQMPQLETLGITFDSPVSNRYVMSELLRRPLTTRAILPNLRWFAFGGPSAYLDAVFYCLTAPLLAKLQVGFFNELPFHLSHLLRFLMTAENLRFTSATLIFKDQCFSLMVYPNKEARAYALHMTVDCGHLQVATAAQFFRVLRPPFSAVDSLTLKYWGYELLSELRNDASPTQWRDLLRSFSNLKTLRVDSVLLVSQLSRSLQFKDGESPELLLPELKKLSYPNFRNLDGAFTTFIGARRISGRPVTVVRF